MNILPAFDPGPRYMTREKLKGLTYLDGEIDAGQGTSMTLPSDTRPGDILLWFHVGDDFGGLTDTSPDGFTILRQHFGSGNYVMNISRRICDGSEAGTLATVSPVGDNNNFVGWMHLRPTDGFPRTFAEHDSATAETSGNPGGQSADSTGASLPCIAVVMYYSDGFVTGETLVSYDNDITTNANLIIALSIENTALDKEYFVDMGDGGGNNLYLLTIVEIG